MKNEQLNAESAVGKENSNIAENKKFLQRSEKESFGCGENNKTATTVASAKSKKKKGSTALFGSVATVVFATATVVTVMPASTEVKLAAYEFSQNSFVYELNIDAKQDDTVILRMKGENYLKEEALDLSKGTHLEKGSYKDLAPQSIYTFEVVDDNDNKTVLIKKQFKARVQKPSDKPINVVTDAVLANFNYKIDKPSHSLIWSIALLDPFNVLSNFSAKVLKRDGTLVKNADVINNLTGAQSISLDGLPEGLYKLEIEADTIFESSDGAVHKVIYSAFLHI